MQLRTLGLALALCLAPLAASQAQTRLNGPMVEVTLGSVENHVMSPDGLWIVYEADQETAGERGIFSVPYDGSAAPVKLSPPLVNGGSFNRIRVSPDNTRVLWQGGHVGNSFDLWSAPIDGSGTAERVSDASGVAAFGFHPDGQRVLFTANACISIAPVDGSLDPLVLSDPNAVTFENDYMFTADGSRVVYSGNHGTGPALYSAPVDQEGAWVQLTPFGNPGDLFFAGQLAGADRAVYRAALGGGPAQLYSIPADGSGPAVVINPPLAANREITGFRITSDGAWVVYRADQNQNNRFQLYRVAIDGSGTSERISGNMQVDGDVREGEFELTPDGSRVLYVADQQTDRVEELYSAPIATPGPWIKHNAPLVPEGDLGAFRISADSQRVVFDADGDVDELRELYSSHLDGSTIGVRLEGQPIGTFVLNWDLAGTRVLWFEVDGQGRPRLYSRPQDASLARADLSGPPVPGGSIASFVTDAAATRVAYRGDTREDGTFEVFGANIDGSQPAERKHPRLPFLVAGDVTAFQLSPLEDRVVYLADQEIDGVPGLYSVPLDGSEAPVRLTAGFPGIPKFGDFTITPDGTWVVYHVDQVFDNRFELFRVPIDGSAPAVRVSEALSADRDVDEWVLSGSTVVYTADAVADDRFHVYTVPLLGPPVATRLNTLGIAGGAVTEIEVDPTGTHILYYADHRVNEDFELWSVPLDGSAAPLVLHPQPVNGGDLESWDISPDGSLVTFDADLDTPFDFEVYSVPIDGTQAPTKLNAPLPMNGDAFAPRFSADGARILFLADNGTQATYELYSVEPDGASLTLLSGALPAGGDVLSFRGQSGATPGGQVVYRADQETDGVVELYSVPADGSQVALKLNETPVAEGDVTSWVVDPSETHVVWRADQDVDERFELFSAPLDGSAPAVALSGPPLDPEGDVDIFLRVAFDGRGNLIYGADSVQDAVFELFHAPVAGGRPPVRLHRPLSGGADTSTASLTFTADGRHVLFLAELDSPDALELWIMRAPHTIGGGSTSSAPGPAAGAGGATQTP